MKYSYILDDLNRFKWIGPEKSNLPFLELDKKEMRSLICGYHGLVKGKIVVIGKTTEEEQELLNHNKIHRLPELKKMLQDTDYKIIKCYEAFMRQLPLPYNLEELSAQRDAWREEINQLEQEIENL
jgi:hypothetical protein